MICSRCKEVGQVEKMTSKGTVLIVFGFLLLIPGVTAPIGLLLILAGALSINQMFCKVCGHQEKKSKKDLR